MRRIRFLEDQIIFGNVLNRIFSIWLLLATVLFPQNLDPSDLFPHHLGDIWEYNFLNSNEPQLQQSEILKDSSNNDTSYIYTIYRELYSDNSFYIDYIIDSLDNVWKLDSTYFCCEWVLYYKLNTDQGDSWIVREYGEFFEIMTYDTSYYGSFWGVDSVLFAEYSFFFAQDTSSNDFWIWLKTHTLASGFGLVRTSSEGTGGTVLVGAVIDGIQYGDTTNVGTVNDQYLIPYQITISSFPNPFNSQVSISITVDQEEQADLFISDIIGNVVYRYWEKKIVTPNHYSFIWSGNNSQDTQLASGIYFITIQTNHRITSKPIILLK